MDYSRGLVLVVEDDRHIAALVKTYLEQEGFQVEIAYDGEAALDLAGRHRPNLVVLDLMLPKLDGLEVCRRLRLDSTVPILMLTARGEEVDRLLGFALAADDYVVKPFSPRELVQRVKAILRRLRPQATNERAPLRHGGLLLDPDAHQVRLRGQPLDLTPLEFRLLKALMSRPGRVLSREALLSRMKTHGEVVIDRVVDVHVGKLRRKIESDPTHPHYIETVRGVGYRFNPEVTDRS
jgi:DNA-binding response OmpR family regulator